jgi:hypothetical protein
MPPRHGLMQSKSESFGIIGFNTTHYSILSKEKGIV